MNYGTRVDSSFTDGFEEYLLEKGLFIVDNKSEEGNDIEVHSKTQEGLRKLITKLELLTPIRMLKKM